jgi:N-acetylneuraminic acid mutarotase
MQTARTLMAMMLSLLLAALVHAEQVDVDAEWSEREPVPEQRTEVSVATDGERIFMIGGLGLQEGADGDELGRDEAWEHATAPQALWAYAPDDDEWEQIGTVPEGVHHTAFAYHEGRLFILGGFRDTTMDPVGDVHIFDVDTGEWESGASMPTPRGAAGFTVLDGRIHVIGGNAEGPYAVAGMDDVEIGADRSVNVHEAYDPAEDSWETLAPMPTPRNHLGAAAIDGRIHAVLGRADGDFRLTVHEIYDPETDSWSEGPPVPTGRSGVAVLAHDGYVYAFGGEDLADGTEQTFDAAERFNVSDEEWEQLPPMPTARHGLGAAVHDDAIYVIAGGPGPALTTSGANERLVLDD